MDCCSPNIVLPETCTYQRGINSYLTHLQDLVDQKINEMNALKIPLVSFKDTHIYAPLNPYRGYVIYPLNCIQKECEAKISFEQQARLFKFYWSLSHDYHRLKFCKRLLKIANVKRRKENKSNDDEWKKNMYQYYLDIDGKRYKSCRKCFLRTLGESENFIRTLHKHLRKDYNGGQFTGKTPTVKEKKTLANERNKLKKSVTQSLQDNTIHWANAKIEESLTYSTQHELIQWNNYNVGIPEQQQNSCNFEVTQEKWNDCSFEVAPTTVEYLQCL